MDASSVASFAADQAVLCKIKKRLKDKKKLITRECKAQIMLNRATFTSVGVMLWLEDLH